MSTNPTKPEELPVDQQSVEEPEKKPVEEPKEWGPWVLGGLGVFVWWMMLAVIFYAVHFCHAESVLLAFSTLVATYCGLAGTIFLTLAAVTMVITVCIWRKASEG